jgi:hypothetical protein
MAKQAPSMLSRLTRRSRRALAALLLLGSSTVMGTTGTATAHDHEHAIDPAALAVKHEVGTQLKVAETADDLLAEDCWAYEDCSAGICAEAICLFVPGKLPQPSDTVASTDQNSVGGATKRAGDAALAGQCGSSDAAPAAESLQRIKDLVAWASGATQWIAACMVAEGPGVAEGAAAANPLAVTPQETRKPFELELAELTCEEPVDVETATPAAAVQPARPAEIAVAGAADDALASEPPRFGAAASVGASPIIATISESYLAYDLSPEDAIAMRMYPIAHPQSNYLGARRTGVYARVDGMASDSLHWHAVTEPAVTVSIAKAPIAKATEQSAEEQVVKQGARNLLVAAVEAVQPGSNARLWLQPQRVGQELGEHAGAGSRTAQLAAAQSVVRLAAAWQRAPLPCGEAWMVLDAPRPAPLLLSDEARMLRVDLACQAAIDVVLAQAARAAAAKTPAQLARELAVSPTAAPAAAIPTADAGLQQQREITRAEALATVCDHAAESLEQLARALRRAGDSYVRQAKAAHGQHSSLR